MLSYASSGKQARGRRTGSRWVAKASSVVGVKLARPRARAFRVLSWCLGCCDGGRRQLGRAKVTLGTSSQHLPGVKQRGVACWLPGRKELLAPSTFGCSGFGSNRLSLAAVQRDTCYKLHCVLPYAASGRTTMYVNVVNTTREVASSNYQRDQRNASRQNIGQVGFVHFELQAECPESSLSRPRTAAVCPVP